MAIELTEGDLLDPEDPDDLDLLDDEDLEPEVETFPIPSPIQKAWDELEAAPDEPDPSSGSK